MLRPHHIGEQRPSLEGAQPCAKQARLSRNLEAFLGAPESETAQTVKEVLAGAVGAGFLGWLLISWL